MYLKNRYEKGKVQVEEKMTDCHDFTSNRTITLSHGDVVQKQAKLGQSAFLISTALGLIQDFQKFGVNQSPFVTIIAKAHNPCPGCNPVAKPCLGLRVLWLGVAIGVACTLVSLDHSSSLPEVRFQSTRAFPWSNPCAAEIARAWVSFCCHKCIPALTTTLWRTTSGCWRTRLERD